MSVRELIEKYEEYNEPLQLPFVDYNKAPQVNRTLGNLAENK